MGLKNKNDNEIKNTRRPFDRDLWKKVNKRDNGTCQNPLCFRKKNTQQHHLFDWSTYPELRFKAGNLVTLCSTRTYLFGLIKLKGCHQKYHKYMGGYRVTTTSGSLYRWYVVNGFKKVSFFFIIFWVLMGGYFFSR